ncbi:hypothetical protein Scep_004697 [Stephania cephalantha]|uniref:DUF4283 domain-containing protein n=1 Tax=Stephania cephalantha TaxID=152367 RepID=A0AAP0PVN3_9MAGN
MWIGLLKLPFEFYDENMLERIGNVLGKFIKVDSQITHAACGKFARISIEVDLLQPLTDCNNETIDMLMKEGRAPIEKGEDALVEVHAQDMSHPHRPHPSDASLQAKEAPSFGPWMITQRRQRPKPRRTSVNLGHQELNNGDKKGLQQKTRNVTAKEVSKQHPVKPKHDSSNPDPQIEAHGLRFLSRNINRLSLTPNLGLVIRSVHMINHISEEVEPPDLEELLLASGDRDVVGPEDLEDMKSCEINEVENNAMDACAEEQHVTKCS